MSGKKKTIVGKKSKPKVKKDSSSLIKKNRLKPPEISGSPLVGSGSALKTVSKNKAEKAGQKKTILKARPENRISKELYIEKHDFPPSYGLTKLTFLVKDPFWIYAYWEIAPSSFELFKKQFSEEDINNASVVLRVYDVTFKDFDGSNANSYFDIDVGRQATNWYVNLWRDGVSYVGEIGLKLSKEGRFLPMARSNCVHTPRMSYSHRAEQIWMKVSDEIYAQPYIQTYLKEVSVNDGYSIGASSAKVRKRVIYLTEEDIKAYYSKLSPLLRDVMSLRLNREFGGKSKKYSFVLEGESPEDRNDILARFPKDYFIKKILCGASEELVILGASERLIRGLGGASEIKQEEAKSRKFFFEIAAEVIVYGRTEPDAEVWFGDKKVSLRSDGTFSLRVSLCDGKLPFEFKAVSRDKKEVRKINTYVERTTRYGC